MGETTTKPRIYVACLAAYNHGRLHGAWIEAAQEAWALWDDVQAMLAVSPIAGAEEWAIHDCEGFGSVHLHESEGFERVAALAQFIAENGSLAAALLNYHEGDLDEAQEALSNRYLGSHASLADFVQDQTEETTTIPPMLRHYIDWQAMARDAQLSGDVFTITAQWDVVHVFAGC